MTQEFERPTPSQSRQAALLDELRRTDPTKAARLEKSLAIINAVVGAAQSAVSYVKSLPRKRPFPVRGNYRKRRAERAVRRVAFFGGMASTAMQVQHIAAAPIPRFPQGGRNGGLAVDLSKL